MPVLRRRWEIALIALAALGCRQVERGAEQALPPASSPTGSAAGARVAAAPVARTAAPTPTRSAPAATGTAAVPHAPDDSFRQSKRALAAIYADHRVTLYCGCSFGAALDLDPSSCGYVSKHAGSRARRVEWEHVVPAEAFGRSFREWRDGDPQCIDGRGRRFKGRKCARKASPAFRRTEADMHNLYPAIGELNGLRSNLSMAEIEGEARELGSCDVEIAEGKFEPRPAIRGDIARTYLYMEATYPGRGIISRKNRKLFEAWSALDAVDRWECERARRIASAQRKENAILALACRKAGL